MHPTGSFVTHSYGYLTPAVAKTGPPAQADAGEHALHRPCVGSSLVVRGRKGESMKRSFRVLAGLVAACALVPAAAAAGPTIANGGGRGTIDGGSPFSQFGFSVTRSADGSVQGNFNCLMAGASQFPGFTLMAVRGQVTSAAISGNTASFDGVGMFQTGNQGKSTSR
jgi:hypothetical protein